MNNSKELNEFKDILLGILVKTLHSMPVNELEDIVRSHPEIAHITIITNKEFTNLVGVDCYESNE